MSQQGYGAYGAPVAPVAPGDGSGPGATPVVHRPWSTVLLTFHWIGAIGGALAAVIGAVALVSAVITSRVASEGINEPWGIVIGAVLLTIAAGALAVCVPLLVLTVQGRRAARAGRAGLLFGVAVAATVVGALGVLGTLNALLLTDPVTTAAGVLVWGAYLAAAIRLLVVVRRQRRSSGP